MRVVKKLANKFNSVAVQPVEKAVVPPKTSRVLAKDVERRDSFPGLITAGAQDKGVISITYFANGSAGNFSETAEFTLDTTPLSLVWFMGTKDKDGEIEKGSGLVPGSNFDSGTVLEGCEVSSGAIANYSCDTDGLTVKITSTNVGWPVFIIAYFYYAIYYDELPEIKELGL